jgi:tetratricopeptide (TPR) repeat protein
MEEFREALRLSASIDNRDDMALGLLNMARLERRSGSAGAARTDIDRAMDLAPPASPFYGELAFEKARILQTSGSLAEATEWARKALGLAGQEERAGRQNLLARLLLQLGDRKEAESLAREALETSRAEGSRVEEANAHRLLGDILAAAGTDAAAMESYEKALAIDRELGVGEKVARDLLLVAERAEAATFTDRALDYYRRSAGASRAGGDRAAAAEALRRAGRMLERTGKKDEARKLFTESERLTKTDPLQGEEPR